MKKLKQFIALMLAVCMGMLSFPSVPVLALNTYTVTYKNADGTDNSTEQVTEGSAVAALPTVTDLVTWVYYDAAGDPIAVNNTFVPDKNTTVYAVTTDTVTASGTLDSGNIIWYIKDSTLYVTGNGTITLPTRSSSDTKYYGTYITDADNIEVAKLEKLYANITPTAVGDEITGGYGSYTKDEMVLGIDVNYEAEFVNQTTHYAASTLANFVPWSAYADSLTSIYFSSGVALDGNFTSYFNVNSSDIYNVQKSIYKNVERIYMYSDTSKVTSQSIMYAGMPKLKHVYVKNGEAYDTSLTVDMSGMFYGDEALLCVSEDAAIYTDIINTFSDTGYVKDMSYLLFDCQSIVSPSVSSWNTSSLEDLSYAFFGCNNAGLKLDGSGSASDISGWEMAQVFSISFAFSGADIDTIYTNENAITIPDVWECTEKKNVITGDINLNNWTLDMLAEAIYTFANNGNISSVTWTSSTPALKDTSVMFAFTPKLKTVNMSGLSTPALKYAISMFYGAGVGSPDASADFSNWEQTVEDARIAFYGTGYKTMDFNGTTFDNLVYGDYMFAENPSLVSLGSDALKDASFSALTCALGMFMDDAALAAVDMSTWDMGNCDTAGYMLKGCKALRTIDISGWDTSSLETIENFADGCYAVTDLNITGLDFPALTDAHRAFADMTSLLSFNAAGVNFPTLTEVNGLFAGDTSLKTAVLSGTFPVLKDTAGMFYNDISLETVNVPNLVSASTENVSYMFFGNISLQSVDMAGWDSSSVKYFQSFLEGADKLETLSIPDTFTTAAALDTGKMYKGAVSLSDEFLQNFIADAFIPTVLEDAYEMFYQTKNLTLADLTGKDFAKLSNLVRMFAENPLLTKIKLPSGFLAGVTDDADAANVFYEKDSTLTYLTIADTTLPAKFAAYDWNGDNRTFLLHNPATINDTERTSLTLTAAEPSAKMQINAKSTFVLGTTPLDVTYAWSYGDTPVAGATDASYTSSQTGTYRAVADIAALANTASVSDTFTLNDGITIKEVEATYTGPDIVKGNSYDKNNVKVVVTYADGSKKTLSSNDFTMNSLTVTAVGSNTFTASYTDASKKVWTDDITVKGIREIGFISATYTGPQIVVGKDYDKKNVSLTAYYKDDTSKTQGFPVPLTSVNTTTVSKEGANTYTAYYKDSLGNSFSDTFTVPGYVPTITITGATAEYKGPDIPVGNNYDKNNVLFTLTYSDGTTETTTGFTVNSIVVSKEGANTYTATYYTNGSSYAAKFTVNGCKAATAESTALKASVSANNVPAVKTGDSGALLLGIILLFGGLLLVGTAVYRYRISKRK